ncbi:MAG: dihydropteroate synthase, partial [Deltaproteobacteria bacterium]|nr:dihydropteroate synthase [Deltaproteobacteria bacterium]
DERAHMDVMVARAARECRLPIMIDTNYADVAELALKRYAGRAVVNSINLEDGGTRADLVGPMAKRHGAALVCLTIDEEGMAMTTERKVAIAKRLVDRCVTRYCLRAQDLFIDPLTFTVGSGDPSLRTSAMETINAIRQIKAEIPGAWTLLGLSNVSFGLSMKGRRVLNSVFLDECLKAGLDAAILNPKHIVPLAALNAADIEVAHHLLFDRGEEPIEAFIRHFETRADFESEGDTRTLSPREAVHEGIVKGKSTLVEPALDELLADLRAEEILNDLLVPAMKHVGDLFGAGRLQLPFVLKSAEAMKRAVDRIRPHFSAANRAGAAKTLVIATVRGDVHDIGKNLVDIIVSNNGFRVVNLGTKVPVQRIMDEARAHGANVVGMSGLLVSSAMLMIDNLKAMSDAGFTTPVLVGGAALTPEFVRDSLKPAYTSGTVSYCADAFAGLVAMQHVAEGKTPPDPEIVVETPRDAAPVAPMVIERVTPPSPPFWGPRIVEDVKIEAVWSYLNEIALFRGRWGFRRGEMGAGEYRELIEKTVRPKYREFQRVIKAERLFTPKIAYGWFAARPDGDALVLTHEGREIRLEFPRQQSGAGLCIADFFHPDGDVAGLFIASIGDAAEERAQAVFERDAFQDYYLFHGLATEATDALAEYAHELMRHDLGIGEAAKLSWQDLVTQKYAGGRYGFGYPACPDLSANGVLLDLLSADRIGVAVTENYQMVPEFSTSAIVCHHPQAKYFTV